MAQLKGHETEHDPFLADPHCPRRHRSRGMDSHRVDGLAAWLVAMAGRALVRLGRLPYLCALGLFRLVVLV